MQRKMVVTGLTLDPKNRSPVVMLRDRRGGRELHIRIGVTEASSIAFELEQVRLARPMSHDLLRNTIEALGGRVARVHIVSLRAHRFAALLVLEQDERTIELDAKPSDGIALALRARAPIFCDSHVLQRAAMAEKNQAATPALRGVKSTRRPAAPNASRRSLRQTTKSSQTTPTQQCSQSSARRSRRASHVEPLCDGAHGGIELERLRPEAFGKYKQ